MLKAVVENLLLAADRPVSVDQLHNTFVSGTDKAELKSALEELREEYGARNLQIIEVADGYQLVTRHEYAEWIRKFLKLDKTSKLSQPSLDTLAIIAYKQPITRQEVEDVRGVDCSGVIRTLLEKKIIAPGGRKKVAGRPIMYRTTQKFLEYFGLKDLSDMPTLDDFKEGELEGDADAPHQTELSFEMESFDMETEEEDRATVPEQGADDETDSGDDPESEPQ